MPSDLTLVILYTGLAGVAIPVGALAAYLENLDPGHLREDLLHGIVAVGGGALLAAVALVLVPEGIHDAGLAGIAIAFSAGAVTFLLVDRAIHQRGGRAAQLLAMVMDFVPESIALGAAFGTGAGGAGALLALLIGLQNLPEGFNSYRELVHGGFGSAGALWILAPLALLGPIGGVAGYSLLAGRPTWVAWMSLFAAGGIL